MTGLDHDLAAEPWIPVRRTAGGEELVSIRDALARAHEYTGVGGETAPQRLALLRLLLAVLHRIDADPDRMREAGRIPADAVDAYLASWADRFGLVDETAPFFQVPGLAGPVQSRVALIPDGALYPALADGMGWEEMARWLVAAQAYHPAGIRPAGSGDPRVSLGKSFPAIAGPMDRVLLWVTGDSLAHTLLLNLTDGEAGVPAWEHPPTNTHTPRESTGPADAFTWQTRRIRLTEGGVIISNGHPAPDGDPMGATVTDTGKPLRSDQPAWQLLGRTLPGGDVTWPHTARLAQNPTPLPRRFHALVPTTDKFRVRIDDLEERTAPIPPDVFQHPERARAAVTYAQALVRTYEIFSARISLAAGGPDTPADTTALQSDLEPAIGDLLTGRGDADTLTTIAISHGDTLAETTPYRTAAWKGRIIDGRNLSLSSAQHQYIAAVYAHALEHGSPPS